MRQEKLKEIER
jgi:hypothetical protein